MDKDTLETIKLNKCNIIDDQYTGAVSVLFWYCEGLYRTSGGCDWNCNITSFSEVRNCSWSNKKGASVGTCKEK